LRLEGEWQGLWIEGQQSQCVYLLVTVALSLVGEYGSTTFPLAHIKSCGLSDRDSRFFMAKAPFSIMRAAQHLETFRRSLSEDHTEIRSQCERCGEILSGTVRNGLPKREVQHSVACSKADRESSAKAG
jgi:hypothetical protein